MIKQRFDCWRDFIARNNNHPTVTHTINSIGYSRLAPFLPQPQTYCSYFPQNFVAALMVCLEFPAALFIKHLDYHRRGAATGESGVWKRQILCMAFWDFNGVWKCTVEIMEFCAIIPRGAAPRKRSFHTCSVLGGSLYIFGGITENKTVLSDMYRYEISSNVWDQVEHRVPSGSHGLVSSGFVKGRPCTAPNVSHHTATVLRDRFILTIGGWNGRKRCADLFCFDTVEQFWFHIPESGDVPVGLSSHTATVISSKDILIIGREGGVHTQRRFAGAFYLNFALGRYTEAPFHASSRSGHIASLIPIKASKENYLFVFGGRKSGSHELIGSWDKTKSTTECCFSKQQITDLLSKLTVCSEPCGRQHSRAIELDPKHLFIFGGETWSGVRENVTNEAFILETDKMRWFKVAFSGGDAPKLVGHSMVITADRIFVFGGGASNKQLDTLWEVKF